MSRVEVIGNATHIYALCDEAGQVRYIGKTEREPKYFDIACRRIEDAQRQQRMFA